MSRCKIMLPRRYSGGLYAFWTDVSVDELIAAGVRVYWHVALYRGGWRYEDLEEPKWRLARSKQEMNMLDFSMIERDGHYYDQKVHIYYNIKDDALWRELKKLEEVNEEKEHEYWREFVASGKADKAAAARGWALRGADPAWYESQTALISQC